MGLRVKNYYTMDERELAHAINSIRQWLFHFPNHRGQRKAFFALTVALSARELKRDEFTRACITHLT